MRGFSYIPLQFLCIFLGETHLGTGKTKKEDEKAL